jgi:DNA polymerase
MEHDPALALSDLRAQLGDCRRCGLCEGRRTLAFGVGSAHAKLLVIGEGPGAEEDRLGEPFVGAAGQMLDRMLGNVLGTSRQKEGEEGVYIANIVKCRPPGNRNPLPEEVERCLPFLRAQIAAVRPRFVLLLGSVALKALYGPDQGILRSRGRWRDLPVAEGLPPARVMPTFHPAYLLRKPEDKRLTFEDLKLLRDAMARDRAGTAP